MYSFIDTIWTPSILLSIFKTVFVVGSILFSFICASSFLLNLKIKFILLKNLALSAVLRDRINSLLTANADLEREVARLRYAEAGN